MKKLLLLILFLGLFSCLKGDIEQGSEPLEYGEQDIPTDASGLEYPYLDPPSYQYCGPGWGRKFCRFLGNYNETIWMAAENNDSDISSISFRNGLSFVSFCTDDSSSSNCEVWKFGENIDDDIKWNLKIKKDQVDVLWFDYEYYGSSEEIEYTIAIKFEIIDGLLNFSNSDGQTFIFNPS